LDIKKGAKNIAPLFSDAKCGYRLIGYSI